MSLLPLSHKKSTLVESRSGVDGVFVWLNGTRGEPFEVTTFKDCATIGDADTAIKDYEAAIGSLANVTFAGVDQPKQVAILNVRPVPEQVRAVLHGIGGTLGTSAAIAVASWTLITTDVNRV